MHPSLSPFVVLSSDPFPEIPGQIEKSDHGMGINHDGETERRVCTHGVRPRERLIKLEKNLLQYILCSQNIIECV